MSFKKVIVLCVIATCCIALQSCLKPIEPPESPVGLPLTVSDYFDPSGYMGAGEEFGNLNVVVTEKVSPPSGAKGRVYEVVFSKSGGKTFGGVKWLYPSNNWGTRAGIPISPDAKKVTFWVKGDNVPYKALFTAGLGQTPHGNFWAASTDGTKDILSEWTPYEIDVSAQVQRQVQQYGVCQAQSLFGWTISGISDSNLPFTFYVAGIVLE